MKSMKMYPVQPDDEVYRITEDYPDPLQKPPFVYLYIGARGSGKSVACANEMMRTDMYDCLGKKSPFEDIIIISSTIGSDESLRHLVEKATETYDTYDDSIVNDILDYQKSKPKKERRHILIIADDIASILKPNASLFKLCSNHRHYLISLCFLYQAPRMVSPIVRSNMTALHIYRTPNMSEQLKLFEDMAFLGDKKMVKDMYDYATNEPYNFMFVDCLKQTVYKWGNTEPEFMWQKYNENGGYNPPYKSPLKTSEINDKNNILTDNIEKDE